jgi:hypothetical protein
MSRSLTASDRSALIRLASTLPKGSDERRVILAGLQEANITKDVLTDVVRTLERASATARTRKAPRSLQTPLKRWTSQAKKLLDEANQFLANPSYTFDAMKFAVGLGEYIDQRRGTRIGLKTPFEVNLIGNKARGSITFTLEVLQEEYMERYYGTTYYEGDKLRKAFDAYCKSQGLTPVGQWGYGTRQWVTPEGLRINASIAGGVAGGRVVWKSPDIYVDPNPSGPWFR